MTEEGAVFSEAVLSLLIVTNCAHRFGGTDCAALGLLLSHLQESVLTDGAGHRPAYSLRTLCRALDYARRAAPAYGLTRSLWDGLSMSFVTQVGDKSYSV